jgi:hypothetical protein
LDFSNETDFGASSNFQFLPKQRIFTGDTPMNSVGNAVRRPANEEEG